MFIVTVSKVCSVVQSHLTMNIVLGNYKQVWASPVRENTLTEMNAKLYILYITKAIHFTFISKSMI